MIRRHSTWVTDTVMDVAEVMDTEVMDVAEDMDAEDMAVSLY